MGDLDDILNEHETKKAEQKRIVEEREAKSKQEAEAKLAAFNKHADEIILPLLRTFEAELKGRGYTTKIMTTPLTTTSGQFYEKITFAFGTEKSSGYVSHDILFKGDVAPYVSITFKKNGTDHEFKKCEATEFALKNELIEIFKKAFK